MTRRKKLYPWEKHYPEGLSWDLELEDIPLYTILDRSAAAFADNNAIDFFGRKTTYAELHDKVNRCAKGLQKIGVAPGTRVGLFMPNCPQYIITYFAVLKIGGVVVNYNPLYTVHELAEQIKDSKTTIMVTLNLKRFFEKTSNLLQTTTLEKVVVCQLQDVLPWAKKQLLTLFKSNELAVVPYGLINVSFNSLLANNGRYNSVDIEPQKDIAVIQYTGGTTGKPKGVLLTHANVVANTMQTGMWFSDGLHEGTEVISGVLPLFHVFAMTVIMNVGIHKACEIVLYPRLDEKLLLKDIDKKGVTILPGVPTLFSSLRNHDYVKRCHFSSLKYGFSGGAPLPLEVKEQFEELSKSSIVEGYGLTESSPVASANPIGGVHKSGSIGIPLPGTVIEIRQTEGRATLTPQGKIGEVCIEGPQVMQGYFNAPEETKLVLKKGRLHTGDLGYMDKDGYVFIVDRLKEMIITSGFNVYPRDIEEQIYKHPAVKDAAVVGVDDARKGQAVKAYIQLVDGETMDEKEMLDFLSGKLTKYKQPSEIEFVSQMPKSIIGKILKKDLKK